ncbi:3-oxoacyl-(acyl-carrier-protein) reductase FabG [Desulfovibrionales bacterium]
MRDLPPVVLVTGGSRGIGRAIALRLADTGRTIYLTYVKKPVEAQAVCKIIIDTGGNACAFPLDVSDIAAVTAFFQTEIKDKVQLEVLVNNAGITKDQLLLRMKDEDFQRVLQVNLAGAFHCTREAAKFMVKQRSGRIINMASVVGLTGNTGQTNYAASKAGLIGLTKSVALELAPRGVTVNAVAPGFIETDMTSVLSEQVRKKILEKIPLGRLGRVEEVAATVAFLASDDAKYITGQVISVNGGLYC